MKKLYLAIAFVVSVLSLSAQDFIVTDSEGVIVESGSTYYVSGDGSESWGYPGGELAIEFVVTALTDVTLIGEKEGTLVDGTYSAICFGLCYAPFVDITDPVELEQGETKEFSMHYTADDYLLVLGLAQSMTCYIYREDNPGDRFVINVVFKYSLDNVVDYSSSEVFSNAYPVPASDVVNFDYNFASSVNAEIAIFNMMGQEVLRTAVEGLQGKTSISVSDLPDGVYFFSLIVDGKTEKSSKIIIRK